MPFVLLTWPLTPSRSLPSPVIRPHVELVNILLGCGEEVQEAISRRIRAQCELNWGALCGSFSRCALTRVATGADQSLTLTPTPATPAVGNGNTLPPGGGQLEEAGWEPSWMEELLKENQSKLPDENVSAAAVQPLQDNSADTVKTDTQRTAESEQ